MADGSVKIDITADDSDIKKTLDGVGEEAQDAAGGLEKLGDSAESAGKGFGVADAAIGNFIGNALSALGSKLMETVGNIAALADETREYREDMAKLDTAFTTAGHSTETAQKAYDDFYKILGESDRSVETVNHLAELTKNEQELAQWSTIAAGVTAKFGDSLPLEGLTEAANETAKVGKVTGPFADALNWASAESSVFAEALGGNDKALQAFNKAVKDGENVEDAFSAALSKMSTEQERSTAITSTLNGLYAEAGAEYNELTASAQAARDATNRMEQAQAAMGAAIEPATTAWQNLKANGMEAIQPVIETVVNKMAELMEWLQQHPGVLSVVTGTLGALAVALGVVTAAVIAQTAAQWAQNAAWLANPITWIIVAIVAAIGALVGGFMYLWNNCEGFRTFWIGLWESIKAVLTPVIEWLKQAFATAWDAIKSKWTEVKPYFTEIWNGIKAVFSVVGEVLGAYFSLAWTVIKNVWSVAVAWFKVIWEGIKAVFSVVATWFKGMFQTAWTGIQAVWSVATGFFKAIWETIKGVFSVVKSVLTGNWSDAWAGIKGIVGTWASYFSSVWESIKSVFSAVASWFSSTFSAAVAGIKSVFSSIVNYFSTIWQSIKNVFNDAKAKFLSIGSNIVAGIRQGISNAWGNLVSWFTGLFGDLKAIAKRILGIASPAKEFIYIAEMIVAGLVVGLKEGKDKPTKALATVLDLMKGYTEEFLKKDVKTVKTLASDRFKTISDHYEELARLEEERKKERADVEKEQLKTEKEYNKKVAELNAKLEKSKKQKNANIKELEEEHAQSLAELDEKKVEDAANYAQKYLDVNEKYNKAVEDEKKRYSDSMLKIEDDMQKLLSDKMQGLTDLGEKYKEQAKTLWEDLDKSITELQANYDKQLADRTASIASSLSLWNEATKNKTSPTTLIKNLNSQIKVLEDYNEAIAKLEERGVSETFLNEIKKMGVGSAGEIEALVRMNDNALNKYVETWEKKNELAHKAALEELEPLKAETELKIEALTVAAVNKYTEMRAKFEEEGAKLAEELKQDMLTAELEGYEAIMSQIDTYTEAGTALMDGVIIGITEKSPELAEAIKRSVANAINAAKEEAGIASPSKVMKKEIGYNLADGVSVGWSDKITDLKNKMAADMQGITARIKTAVTLENARMAQGVGVRDTGFAEVAQAVGMQTAGINSLASEYRRGSSAQITVPLILDGREFGRAVVDLGSAETVRTGPSLVMA